MAGENENPTGENEDAEDQDTGDDEDGDEDGDGEGGTGYTPPTKEAWEAAQRQLKKANAEAKRLRLRAKGKPGAAVDTDSGDSGADTSGADPDARVKRLAGIAALASEGMTRDQARAAVRLLDLSDVEVDEDGDADGLEDAVADLKAQFPAMFPAVDRDDSEPASRRPRPRTSGGRSKDAGNARSADDQHTSRLLKAAGYR